MNCNLLLSVFVFVLSLNSFGQSTFRINSPLADSVLISINSVEYIIDSDFQQIPTNHPLFDTLIFLQESDRKIICNFKPDSSYTISFACCASLDIVSAWKYVTLHKANWDFEENFGEIQELMLDRPKITFRLKNQTKQDSIYAWYVDYACFPSFKLIDKNGWTYGSPSKCFYWSNISSFEFFKTYADLENVKDEKGIINDIYPTQYEDFKSLNSIHTRLFDNDKYILEYDLKTGKIDVYNKN